VAWVAGEWNDLDLFARGNGGEPSVAWGRGPKPHQAGGGANLEGKTLELVAPQDDETALLGDEPGVEGREGPRAEIEALDPGELEGLLGAEGVGEPHSACHRVDTRAAAAHQAELGAGVEVYGHGSPGELPAHGESKRGRREEWNGEPDQRPRGDGSDRTYTGHQDERDREEPAHGYILPAGAPGRPGNREDTASQRRRAKLWGMAPV
jgi:hypothetical protein